MLVVKLTDQRLPACRESVLRAHPQDVIEFDEVWSFVHNKQRPFKQLLRKMPNTYRRYESYSDGWRAYNLLVHSSAHHEKVGKDGAARTVG